MFEIDPKSLTDTRIQLHWASQLLSAVADAKLEKAPDDSHSNLDWNPTTKCLEGRAGCNLNVERFSLEYDGDSFELDGKTLLEAAAWLSEKLGTETKLRDYEMPAHAVDRAAHGAALDGNRSMVHVWTKRTCRKR